MYRKGTRGFSKGEVIEITVTDQYLYGSPAFEFKVCTEGGKRYTFKTKDINEKVFFED
jgi:hypothetical protein